MNYTENLKKMLRGITVKMIHVYYSGRIYEIFIVRAREIAQG